MKDSMKQKKEWFLLQKNLLKTLAEIVGDISSSVVNLTDLNREKMEINVKEHSLKELFKETIERMIQQNNMEIISKWLVDNVIKNAVKELKDEKNKRKKITLA